MVEATLLDDVISEVLPPFPLYVPFTAEELSDVAGIIRTILVSVREISGSEQRGEMRPRVISRGYPRLHHTLFD